MHGDDQQHEPLSVGRGRLRRPQRRGLPPEAEALRLRLVVLDEAFERARRRLGDAVPCRRGCSACCEQAAVFEIHADDAALLEAGRKTLDDATADALASRSREVLRAVHAAAGALALEGEPCFSGWAAPQGLAGIPSRALAELADRVRMPCPALDASGACVLHAFRPAICRLQGIPWRDPRTLAELPDACRLDPRQAALAPQPLDLLGLDAGREAFRAASGAGKAGPQAPARTLVAEALLRSEAS